MKILTRLVDAISGVLRPQPAPYLRNAAVDLLGVVYVRSDNEPGHDGPKGLTIRG